VDELHKQHVHTSRLLVPDLLRDFANHLDCKQGQHQGERVLKLQYITTGGDEDYRMMEECKGMKYEYNIIMHEFNNMMDEFYMMSATT
jgi:hypothetical protein